MSTRKTKYMRHWRAVNREHYRNYQREYRRKYRARQRQETKDSP